MKIDYDYLKQMLNAMESMDKPEFNNIQIFNKLYPAPSIELSKEYRGITTIHDDDRWNNYVFHLFLLADHDFISCNQQDSKQRHGIENMPMNFDLPNQYIPNHTVFLRLTKDGHEFLIALNNDTLFNKIKKNVGKITLGAIKAATIKLAEATATSLLS